MPGGEGVSTFMFTVPDSKTVDYSALKEKIAEEVAGHTKEIERHLHLGLSVVATIPQIYCSELRIMAATLNKYDKKTQHLRLKVIKVLKVIARAKSIDAQMRTKVKDLKDFKIKAAEYGRMA